MPDHNPAFAIRPYRPEDQAGIMDLFIRVNRSLALPEMEEAFATYVARSLKDEIGRIDQYYDAGRNRSFWVASDGARLLGNFGLEPAEDGAVEIRRIYVDFPFRRLGVARAMIAHAETCAKEYGFDRIVLSTSSLQRPALSLYRSAGFVLLREEIATTASHKTIGNGILRFHFEKSLADNSTPKNQACDPRQIQPVQYK